MTTLNVTASNLGAFLVPLTAIKNQFIESRNVEIIVKHIELENDLWAILGPFNDAINRLVYAFQGAPILDEQFVYLGIRTASDFAVAEADAAAFDIEWGKLKEMVITFNFDKPFGIDELDFILTESEIAFLTANNLIVGA